MEQSLLEGIAFICRCISFGIGLFTGFLTLALVSAHIRRRSKSQATKGFISSAFVIVILVSMADIVLFDYLLRVSAFFYYLGGILLTIVFPGLWMLWIER